MNGHEDPVTAESQGQMSGTGNPGGQYPDYPSMGGIGADPPRLPPAPEPGKEGLKEGLIVIPAGMYMVISFLVSILLLVLFLRFLGYLKEFLAYIMIALVIIAIISFVVMSFAQVIFLFKPTPKPNYQHKFSLDMVKDPSRKPRGNDGPSSGQFYNNDGLQGPHQPPHTLPYPCPRCTAPLTHIPHYNRWYCHQCGEYAGDYGQEYAGEYLPHK